MKPATLPPAEYLHECFDYDPIEGTLTWRWRPRGHFASDWAYKVWNATHSKGTATHLKRGGRLGVCVDNHHYFAHRIIWKIVTGREPPDYIDHEDMNPANNKWLNLREATQSQNMCNRGAQRDNKSGFKGVSWDKEKCRWIAYIKINRRARNLGRFDTPGEAHAAYCSAALTLHGEFRRTEIFKNLQPLI